MIKCCNTEETMIKCCNTEEENDKMLQQISLYAFSYPSRIEQDFLQEKII